MTYYILFWILASGVRVEGNAYGSKDLCHRAAHHQAHQCRRITFEEDR